mmetsp:Transcript_47764/g.35014  ORF Transcript_47764/g.35014 Transcript_47764/m.35014 type:complete len:250 (+) Transcript_47764:325-1074(+)
MCKVLFSSFIVSFGFLRSFNSLNQMQICDLLWPFVLGVLSRFELLVGEMKEGSLGCVLLLSLKELLDLVHVSLSQLNDTATERSRITFLPLRSQYTASEGLDAALDALVGAEGVRRLHPSSPHAVLMRIRIELQPFLSLLLPLPGELINASKLGHKWLRQRSSLIPGLSIRSGYEVLGGEPVLLVQTPVISKIEHLRVQWLKRRLLVVLAFLLFDSLQLAFAIVLKINSPLSRLRSVSQEPLCMPVWVE